VALVSCAESGKKTRYKKFPSTQRRPPATAPKHPETVKPETPQKPLPEIQRTNAKPSTADIATPKRQASMRLIERGTDLMAAKDYARAQATFRDAVNVDPSNGIAYYSLAAADAKMGQAELATGLLDKAEALLGADEEWMTKIDALRSELSGTPSKPIVPSVIDKAF
jgi:tetratricopeptide (TPR) repeat protein